jgi:hypothetical protein
MLRHAPPIEAGGAFCNDFEILDGVLGISPHSSDSFQFSVLGSQFVAGGLDPAASALRAGLLSVVRSAVEGGRLLSVAGCR